MIEPGDVLESIHDPNRIAYVRQITKNGISVYIDEKKDTILNEQLCHWKLANPIKDNRVVSSITFATRFIQFLKWIPEKWITSQPHYMEEYNYMLKVANHLLKYQIETVTNKEEIDYLKNNKLL